MTVAKAETSVKPRLEETGIFCLPLTISSVAAVMVVSDKQGSTKQAHAQRVSLI